MQLGAVHGRRWLRVRVADPRQSSTGEVPVPPATCSIFTPTKLVPLRGYSHPSTAYVATFVRSKSGFCFRRKYTSSLFIPPEGCLILDDIVVTFIYFECKWRDKEGAKARTSLSGPVM